MKEPLGSGESIISDHKEPKAKPLASQKEAQRLQTPPPRYPAESSGDYRSRRRAPSQGSRRELRGRGGAQGERGRGAPRGYLSRPPPRRAAAWPPSAARRRPARAAPPAAGAAARAARPQGRQAARGAGAATAWRPGGRRQAPGRGVRGERPSGTGGVRRRDERDRKRRCAESAGNSFPRRARLGRPGPPRARWGAALAARSRARGRRGGARAGG